MAKPAVSIITITYNHEKFIERCIESVLAQTFPDWEMLIIDDGSIDNTQGIVRNYSDERIRYTRQEHVGPWQLKESYNRGLSLAQGDYIAIIEGDDYWPPYKLETQVSIMNKTDAILCYGRLAWVNQDEKLLGEENLNYLNGSILNNDPIGSSTRYMLQGVTLPFPCTVLIRKDAILRIGGFQQPGYLPLVDYPTFLSLSLSGRFYYEARVMGYWRRYGSSITNTFITAIAEGVVRYAKDFYISNRDALKIEEDKWAVIERESRRILSRAYIRFGRFKLLTKEWKMARESFRHAREISSRRHMIERTVIQFGILASYFKMDMEILFKLFGKQSILES